MAKRTELRTVKDSMDILARMSDTLINGQTALTQEQSVQFSRALNDIASRLERAADVLSQLMQLSRPETPLKNVRLTRREMEILSYLAEGQTNGEIAARCWISENTVKFHLKNLFRKLEIRDRGQALMIAKGLRNTLTPPS
jgi:DNA-binding NarL/FixJ family response regulator